MPDIITVKAAPGIKVPREDKPTTYIDDTNPVTITPSAYYRRRIADGDLIGLDGVQSASITDAEQPTSAHVEDDGNGDKE